MKVCAEPVDGFDTSVVCDGFALERSTVLCPEEAVGMFIDICAIKLESSEARMSSMM